MFMSENLTKPFHATLEPNTHLKDYSNILETITLKIIDAQSRAITAVNYELIEIYREIGKIIHHQQINAKWGDSVIDLLAKDLQNSFPGMKGFSQRNLRRMKDFYLEYCGKQKLATLSSKISWSHNMAILSKCKDSLEKEFYMKMSKKNGWSYRVLIHQIENMTFEKIIINQTSFEKNLPTNLRPEAKLAVKDEYTLDFLELADKHSERELEKSIVKNIERFLREVGGAYAFMGSQYRLEVEGQEFFVDLLLYHRKLKSLVAIELKVTEFIPEYVGKMQFYLAVLDDKVRIEGENPSIGIILCKSKKRTIVEYALKEANKPINVSSYQMVKKLPHELENELPSPEQISKLLDHVD